MLETPCTEQSETLPSTTPFESYMDETEWIEIHKQLLPMVTVIRPVLVFLEMSGLQNSSGIVAALAFW